MQHIKKYIYLNLLYDGILIIIIIIIIIITIIIIIILGIIQEGTIIIHFNFIIHAYYK